MSFKSNTLTVRVWFLIWSCTGVTGLRSLSASSNVTFGGQPFTCSKCLGAFISSVNLSLVYFLRSFDFLRNSKSILRAEWVFELFRMGEFIDKIIRSI